MKNRLYSSALISALGLFSLVSLGGAASAEAINANPYKDGKLLILEPDDASKAPATKTAPQDTESKPSRGHRGDSIDSGEEGG